MTNLRLHAIPLALSLSALVAGCGGAGDPAASAADPTAASDELRARTGGPTAPAQPTVLCAGEPESVSGVVVAIGTPDEGLTIDAGGALETFFGIGPYWYWSDAGLDRPVVGDAVALVVTHVTTTDARVILALTVDGETMQLRDPTTCAPLYSGRGRAGP
jgi:hypothetical protein